MSEQILAAIIGGISGAIVSGIVYWLLDKHKEFKLKRKYKQQLKDVFMFFKKFPTFKESKNNLDKFFNDIGSYRSNKISPILEKANILKVTLTNSDSIITSLKSGFHSYTDKQIKEIKRDIKNGLYDEYLV